MKGNTNITINGQPYSLELKMDQDGQWTINFIELKQDSKDSKDFKD